MLKEKIDRNIRDSFKIINLRGVDITWKFSMLSFYDLLNDFDYQNEIEVMEKLQQGDSITLIRVFYTGIVWEDEKVSFKNFLLFLDYGDVIDVVKNFVENNIVDYLYPKKKV